MLKMSSISDLKRPTAPQNTEQLNIMMQRTANENAACKRGTFSVKMVYRRVRGWTSGRSLLVLNFAKYPTPSPPPRGGQDRNSGQLFRLYLDSSTPCSEDMYNFSPRVNAHRLQNNPFTISLSPVNSFAPRNTVATYLLYGSKEYL